MEQNDSMRLRVCEAILYVIAKRLGVGAPEVLETFEKHLKSDGLPTPGSTNLE